MSVGTIGSGAVGSELAGHLRVDVETLVAVGAARVASALKLQRTYYLTGVPV